MLGCTTKPVMTVDAICMNWVHAAETEYAGDINDTSISGSIGMSEVSG